MYVPADPSSEDRVWAAQRFLRVSAEKRSRGEASNVLIGPQASGFVISGPIYLLADQNSVFCSLANETRRLFREIERFICSAALTELLTGLGDLDTDLAQFLEFSLGKTFSAESEDFRHFNSK